MRVLIDASPASFSKGVGYYRGIVCILNALRSCNAGHRYHIVTQEASVFNRFARNGNPFIFERPPGHLPMLHRKGSGLLGRMFLAGFDVVHFPLTDIWYSPRGKKAVVTIHDLAPLRFPGRFFLNAEQEKVYRAHLEKIVTYSSYIITSSDHTRGDVISFLGVSPEKLVTIYTSVDTIFLNAVSGPPSEGFSRLGIETPYFLFVGDFDFRKNVPLLLRAFSLYRERGGNAGLVLVGRHDANNPVQYPPLEMEKIKERNSIRWLQGVGDDVLPEIYQRALGLVFPSSFEGFGSPLAEAMASSLPVITVPTACLPEVVGEAALIVELNEAPLAEAMRKLEQEESLREKLIERGRKQLQKYLPATQGEALIHLYEKTARDK